MNVRSKKFLARLIGLFIAICIVLWLFNLATGTLRTLRQAGLTPFTIAKLVFDSGATLKESNGRTNIVLLGIGGGSHDGSDLTDTMIVLSIHQVKHSMALISIPRDVWSDELKDKINSAYHYGEEKKKGGGLVLSKAMIEDVVGLPIHYGVVVDFSGFKNVIDVMGGVTINVPKAFTDSEYPIAGKENDACEGDPEYRCRYEALHFDAGMQHMDGERALKYVRSRHSEGSEGSDFARSRRQQEVIVALKQQFVKLSLWTSPKKVTELIHALDDATDTDMNIGEFLTVGKDTLQSQQNTIQKISIDDQLMNPPLSWYDGKYVLVPKENYTQIHTYISSKLQ